MGIEPVARHTPDGRRMAGQAGELFGGQSITGIMDGGAGGQGLIAIARSIEHEQRQGAPDFVPVAPAVKMDQAIHAHDPDKTAVSVTVLKGGQ